MTTFVEKQLAAAEGKLLLLMAEVRQDATLYARVQLWVGKFTGGRPLSDWLHDETVPLKERVMIARSLVDLLLAKHFDRLPSLPAGQERAGAKCRSPELPADMRAFVRAEVRKELADVFNRIAKVLAA